jgi:hypothetical protein
MWQCNLVHEIGSERNDASKDASYASAPHTACETSNTHLHLYVP